MEPTLSQTGDDLDRARERSLVRTRPPTDVPGYEPERFLGAGAYGEVWVAVDKNTARRVAIKFYAHRGGLDWSLLSREVEKLAFLFTDRYVVQLIEVGWDANPPYYVMEYLERGSLADRLKEGPLSVAEAVVLFREVAQGLVHAHGKGILHCDLKPANILLDQDFKPRLADFGQSRLSHEQAPALGTLFYMAPEQADLSAVPDAAWDVYALGAVMYCMLVGEPPYRSEDAAATIESAGGVEEQLTRYRDHIRRSPPPNVHRQVPGVDRDLTEIIDRCLRVDAARRYPNPQAVVDALAARAERRARRPLMILGAVGPALLLLIASLFAWHTFNMALERSEEAITKRALESNWFAAQFVAENVAAQINRRWEILEQEAGTPRLAELLAASIGQPRTHAARRQLQDIVESLDRLHPELDAASWVIMDAKGIQLARNPFDEKTIDKEYSFRDYFHGLGRNFEPQERQFAPIRQSHLSSIFVSSANQEQKVAFSVPVFAADREQVLGVMSMTVELGHFAELRAGAESSTGDQQFAVLVDLKNDYSGRPGLVLEHPELTARSLAPDSNSTGIYLSSDQVSTLAAIRAGRRAETSAEAPDLASLSLTNHFQDPVGGNYAGRWLAAMQPVMVEGRTNALADTGWAVIVQERYDTATSPVRHLQDRLVREALLALATVLVVVSGLWAFVAIVLNESPRSRLARWLRRRSGWTGPSLGPSSRSSTSRRTATQRMATSQKG